MLETLLDLLRQLIDLAHARQQSRERALKEVIEPLFHEIEPVATDYFSIFSYAHEAMESSPHEELNWDSSKLIEMGRQMINDRREIRAVAQQIDKNVKDEMFASFAGKVATFFYSTRLMSNQPIGGGFRSTVAGLPLLFEQAYEGRYSREEALGFIMEAEEKLRQAWLDLCGEYAVLRLYCVSPSLVRRQRKSEKAST